MDILKKERVVELIDNLKSEHKEKNKEKHETFEVQISLKGYDPQKDARFDTNVLLPYKKREHEKILVVSESEELEGAAKKLNLNFANLKETQGTTKEKKQMKKKLAKFNHSIITHGNFIKKFEIFFILWKRKIHFPLKTAADLENLVEQAQRTVKFKIKKTIDLSFPCGFTGMESEQIYENIFKGLSGLCGVLKNGSRNIGTLTLKTDFSKSQTIL